MKEADNHNMTSKLITLAVSSGKRNVMVIRPIDILTITHQL